MNRTPPKLVAPFQPLLCRAAAALLTVALLALTASPAAAGAGRFTPVGPDGGTVEILTVDPARPSTLYAGTVRAGVFRSLDGGVSWQPAGEELAGSWVKALAVAASEPDVVYAGAFGPRSGVFRSADRGATWTSVGGGRVPSAWGLAVHPTDPDGVVVANGDRVWKTTDAGASWTDVTPDTPSNFFRTAVFDPADPSTLYLGTNGGIFKTTNGGDSWSQMRPLDFILPLVIDPRQPQTLWAGTGGGVLRTLDGGTSWAFLALPIDPHDTVTALALDPSEPQVVYAGGGPSTLGETLFRSVDGGATWTPLLATSGVFSLAADPQQHPTTLWAGLRGLGVLRSTDGGTTWAPARRGLRASGITALVVDPQQPGRLVAGVEEGPASLITSDDGGETWAPVEADLGIPGAGFRTDALVSDPSQPGLLAGFQTDALVPDPSQPGLLYGTFSGILRRSPDFGRTWEALPGHPPFPVRSLAVTGADHLVASAQETVPCDLGLGCEPFPFLHLFHSTDGGATWQEVLPSQQPSFAKGLLATAPSDPSVVYFVRDGLFTSTDGGTTWRQVNSSSQPTLFALAVDPRNSRILYAGTRLGAGGVLRSLDGGETWEARGSGLPLGEHASEGIRDLLIDPSDPQRLYAASDFGVFESRDGGGSWQPFSDGLAGSPVSLLALDPRGPGTVYAGGARDGGLFARTRITEGCSEGPTTLCLHGGRFRVEVSWQDFQGGSGVGHPVSLLEDSGGFWFFAPDNLEVMVKVLDGRPINGHFWVFLGSLTNVAFELSVTDTMSGKVWRHSNPSRHFASLGDVTAF